MASILRVKPRYGNKLRSQVAKCATSAVNRLTRYGGLDPFRQGSSEYRAVLQLRVVPTQVEVEDTDEFLWEEYYNRD